MIKSNQLLLNLLRIIGSIPLFTVIAFYLLVFKVFLWNGWELPYWKHPYPSEMPFDYHNGILFLLVYFSKYISIPISMLIIGYFVYARKIQNVNKINIVLIGLGILFFVIMEMVDPFGLFVWWLD